MASDTGARTGGERGDVVAAPGHGGRWVTFDSRKALRASLTRLDSAALSSAVVCTLNCANRSSLLAIVTVKMETN